MDPPWRPPNRRTSLHPLYLPQWSGRQRRAVPGGSDGLAQNKGLIHRPQMLATLTRAQFFVFAQPKERFVGLTNTQRAVTRGKVGLHPIMIAGQPQAAISAPIERTPPTHE
jgi:hypothetical protein